MLKICTVVCGMNCDLSQAEGDLIGADRGALTIACSHRRMVLAVGDFDSVNETEMQLIRQWADEVIVLPAMKDDTDMVSALKQAAQRGYRKMVLLGALGGRQDHQMANLLTLMHGGYPLEIRDENNILSVSEEGTVEFTVSEMKYLSFFAVVPSVITLQGFVYPLDHYKLSCGDTLCVSNEIVNRKASLTVEKGKVLIMRCKDGSLKKKTAG